MSSTTAWVYNHEGYPSALRLASVPLPVTLQPHQILIRVSAASINPVDIQLMNFPLWPYLPSFLVPALHPVAQDFSGTVVSAGSSSSSYAKDDRVFGMIPIFAGGALQSHIVVDTRSTPLACIPKTWDAVHAAAVPLVYLTARTCISAVEPYVSSTKPKIAVLGGSSSTGAWTVRLARDRGWTVLASCSGAKAEYVRSLGAEVLDYTSSPDAVRKGVAAFAPDAVVDCVGGTECLDLAGRYVTIVGDKTSRAQMGGAATYAWNPRMLARAVLGWVGLGRRYDCVNLELRSDWLEEVAKRSEGDIAVDSVFAFEDAKMAFERLNTGRAKGKVVITVEH